MTFWLDLLHKMAFTRPLEAMMRSPNDIRFREAPCGTSSEVIINKCSVLNEHPNDDFKHANSDKRCLHADQSIGLMDVFLYICSFTSYLFLANTLVCVSCRHRLVPHGAAYNVKVSVRSLPIWSFAAVVEIVWYIFVCEFSEENTCF